MGPTEISIIPRTFSLDRKAVALPTIGQLVTLQGTVCKMKSLI